MLRYAFIIVILNIIKYFQLTYSYIFCGIISFIRLYYHHFENKVINLLRVFLITSNCCVSLINLRWKKWLFDGHVRVWKWIFFNLNEYFWFIKIEIIEKKTPIFLRTILTTMEIFIKCSFLFFYNYLKF